MLADKPVGNISNKKNKHTKPRDITGRVLSHKTVLKLHVLVAKLLAEIKV